MDRPHCELIVYSGTAFMLHGGKHQMEALLFPKCLPCGEIREKLLSFIDVCY